MGLTKECVHGGEDSAGHEDDVGVAVVKAEHQVLHDGFHLHPHTDFGQRFVHTASASVFVI